MSPTLPSLAAGAEVFGLLHVAGHWKPTRLGRVRRVTASGYVLDTGRVCGRTECPLFTSLADATTWAEANRPKIPRGPDAFGNVTTSRPLE